MKAFKRILLAILSLPFLVAMLFANLLWASVTLVMLPFIILFEWLKDDIIGWTNDWWKVFFIPIGMYLEVVWDVDFI